MTHFFFLFYNEQFMLGGMGDPLPDDRQQVQHQARYQGSVTQGHTVLQTGTISTCLSIYTLLYMDSKKSLSLSVWLYVSLSLSLFLSLSVMLLLVYVQR